MKEKENPLNSIFILKNDNSLSPKIKSLQNINNFFIYLKEPKISEEKKSKVIDDLTGLIKAYRGVSEYFSFYENKSIYTFLMNIYLDKNSTKQMKISIENLIQELILNIEVNKRIFHSLFQKLAIIFRNINQSKDKNSEENLFTNCLNLLNIMISDNIENRQKPHNYFICNGEGNFFLNLSSHNISIDLSLTFIINFKIYSTNETKKIISNILKINFKTGNNIEINLDLCKCNLVMNNSEAKKLVVNEWMNLVIIITGAEKKINFYFLLNGESHLIPVKYSSNNITYKDQIDSIIFFNNFYGEVSSISMISQNKDFESSSVPPPEFLEEFKLYKEGLWKKKKILNFLDLLKKVNLKKKRLKLIAAFCPKNVFLSQKNGNIVESINNNINNNLLLKFTGNIRYHNYECYQKKLYIINVISSILPIAEMFLIHPNLLNSTNFELYLKIIINILKHRKKNMQNFKKTKFFQILSLFIEKYPNNLFNDKIMELFFEIGRCIFSSKFEKLNLNYFHHILLNEKILSKYSEELQIKFWNNLLKFTQSDKYQIANYINLNKLCLILRFYDRNKYTEMCCQRHLNMIKPEYIGNNNIMKPDMPKKLSYLENILISIIYSKDAKSACSLFKLLILDLSPCLTLFIINIFIKTFQKTIKTVKWKDQLIMELINSKYEVIIINAFNHSLPEIKIEILKLMYEIYQRLLVINKGSYFVPFENMIKTCFLPQNMFYSNIQENNKENKEINKKFIKDKNNETNENKNNNVLIFHDNLLEEYKEILLNILYLWIFGYKFEEDIKKINFSKNLIKNPNIILLLFAYIKELNDLNYTLKFLDQMIIFISNPQNSYTIFSNKSIYLKFLSFNFKYYKSSDKKCFEKSKTILLDIFINSLLYMEKNHVINPCSEMYIIFDWLKDIIAKKAKKDINDKNKIYDFLTEFFFEILTSFKIKFDPKMIFNLKDMNFSPHTNYYLKNYLYLITNYFEFIFLFYSDNTPKKNLISICSNNNINSEQNKHINSMRLNPKGDKITIKWLDYQFFEDLYKRFNYFWGIKSYIQKLFKKNAKGNRVLKYEEILKESILDKDNKNIFLKELELLCYEVNNDKKNNIIISPINIITISLMCILSSSNDEKDVKYWLKELKYFIRFLIISSCNLIKNNQNEETFNLIQDKVICVLSSLISFLNNLMNIFNKNNNKILYEKVKKNLQKILCLCLIVTSYQYKYALEHKNKLNLNILKIFKNQNTNDISSCAVFILFTEIIKDNKTNLPVLTKEKLDQLALSQYVTVVENFNKQEIVENFYENQKLKNKIDISLYNYDKLKKVFEQREIDKLQKNDEYDYKYKTEIILLLPKYEKELMKHSNNLLEKNIKYKNMYKISKKNSFTWLGSWTDKKLFFENNEILKQKVINHLTKNFMKSILAPIYDISYYLPEFSGFKIENLFNKNKNGNNLYNISLDIDKILKNSDISKKNEKNENIVDKKSKEQKKENYQRDIYNKSNPELAKGYLKIANHLDFGKEEEFFFIEKQNDSEENPRNSLKSKKNKYFLCCLVKPSHHIKGVVFIDDNKLVFKVFLNQKTGNEMTNVEIGFTKEDDDFDSERQTCFGSYFICHPKDKDLYKISIKYNDINYLFRRRYYYKNSGLEIFTRYNKSFYLNFKYEEDREKTINEIILKLNDCSKILNDLKNTKDSFDNIIGYENNILAKNKKLKKTKISKISKKIELWKNWEISNFELIMWLNIFSNRSYNDLSQYPVFPWLLLDYEDPITLESSINEEEENSETKIKESGNILLEKYRDMGTPMGLLTNTEEGEIRKELYIENFENLNQDKTAVITPYLFGSNYSNPTYVCNYLVRIFPYSHISIELQGDKFDDANRLFNDVKNSFKSASTQKTDVRELIPEFYCFPEMFFNINDLNLGIKDNGDIVNDVITPCRNNPYEFTVLMRNILENDVISGCINKWIDIIFGYKNKGKEAEEALNLFTEASYQENVDLKNVENKELYLRYAEFGLIPNQISTKEFEKKLKKEEILKNNKEITDSAAELKHFLINNQTNDNNNNLNNDNSVLLVKIFNEGRINILMNNFTFIEKKINFSIFDKIYNSENINIIKLDEGNNQEYFYNRMSEFYSDDSIDNKCIKFYNHGKALIIGGFYDGKLLIISLEKEPNKESKPTSLYPFYEEKPILSVELDIDENYLFLGNSMGNICIYQTNQDITKWEILYIKTEHLYPISHIHCNNELNLWCATSINGFINLYTLPKCKMIRSIKLKTKKCSYSFISSSPLPSIIIINDEENNSEVYVYSINGKFIFKYQEYVHIYNPLIIKDIYSFEYLAFSNKNSIVIKKLPNLDIQVNIDCEEDIFNLCISSDNKNIFTFDKNGKKIFLIKGN